MKTAVYQSFRTTNVPARIRTAVGNQRHLVSDVARLELGKKLLETYDRVIWIDADVYICNPSSFLVDFPPVSFCSATNTGFIERGKPFMWPSG